MLSHEHLSSKILILVLLCAFGAATVSAQDAKTGGVRGRVRVDTSSTPANINVTVRQGDREVAHTTTNGKGEFEVRGLAPGVYGLTFRKAGLSVGRMEQIEVRAGKVRALKDRLFLPVDEGAIVFLRGSVFDASGRSFAGARVEVALLGTDGSLKKLDSRISNETGSFVFRLTPAAARYRVTVKADGMETATKDVDIEGAAIYRVALTLTPAAK